MRGHGRLHGRRHPRLRRQGQAPRASQLHGALIHQPSSGVQGQQTDIQIVADETKWIRQHLNELLAEATGQPIERINEDTERDRYLRAAEACEYGLVDKVITSRADAAKEE